MSTLPSALTHLLAHPQSYDFFQAVRVIEQSLATDKSYVLLSQQQDPAQETLRFRGTAALRHPMHEIDRITLQTDATSQPQFSLQVSFLSLFGACGILPHHYTELIIKRLKLKDTAFNDFLDVLNHRLVSLFYRAWQKYHLPTLYETAQCHSTSDGFTTMIDSLTGNDTDHLQDKLIVAENVFRFYGGIFANTRRSAHQLQRLLSDYLNVPVKIKPCQAKRLTITLENRSSLRKGQNNQLGNNIVLGQYITDTQAHFRIQLGPLTYPQFQTFTPRSRRVIEISQLTKRYVGLVFDFDIQLLLKAAEVPACQLSRDTMLGWNTWLKSQPFRQDANDAILLPRRT
jgi:type VI secretion system protein ImpH